MGIFNKLFGGADGVRESITEKYYQHLEIARKSQGDARDQQIAALYGALATRYMARMKRKTEIELMGEILPFANIDSASPYSSLDALCDYVIYIETPHRANISQLTKSLNLVLAKSPELGAMGLVNNVPWIQLIDFNVVNEIKSRI